MWCCFSPFKQLLSRSAGPSAFKHLALKTKSQLITKENNLQLHLSLKWPINYSLFNPVCNRTIPSTACVIDPLSHPCEWFVTGTTMQWRIPKCLAAGGTGRDNCRCAKAHRNEALLCDGVGDKLQSCELKWFKASAKGDKSTRLCPTNHCSRMVTLLAAGGHMPHPMPSAPSRRIWNVLKWKEFPSPGTEQRKGSVILSLVCCLWLTPRPKHTKAEEFLYPSVVITSVFHLIPAL